MDYDLKESRNCCDNCCIYHPACYSMGCVRAAALATVAIYFCGGAFFGAAAFAHRSLPILALAVACWIMCALAALYHRGARADHDAPMVPLLVAELLLRLAFGWTVAALWIGTVLANYNQLDEWLPAWIALHLTPTALLTAAVAATAALAVHMRVYFFFYGGYRRVKKANDRRRADTDDGESAAAYARLSPNRARPTAL